MFVLATELDSWAFKAGLHPLKLENTVEIYDAQLTSKLEDPFERTFRPAAIR